MDFLSARVGTLDEDAVLTVLSRLRPAAAAGSGSVRPTTSTPTRSGSGPISVGSTGIGLRHRDSTADLRPASDDSRRAAGRSSLRPATHSGGPAGPVGRPADGSIRSTPRTADGPVLRSTTAGSGVRGTGRTAGHGHGLSVGASGTDSDVRTATDTAGRTHPAATATADGGLHGPRWRGGPPTVTVCHPTTDPATPRCSVPAGRGRSTGKPGGFGTV